jgi:carbon monoxide dehydrogenase subunit G
VIRIRKRLDVAVAQERLFAYLVEPGSIVDYVGPIQRIRRSGDARVSVGERLVVEVSFLGMQFEQPAECTLSQPPRRFACRSVGGRFHFEAGFQLRATAEGTRMDGWGDATAPALFRFAEPLLGMLIDRQVERDLLRLKRRLETEKGRPAGGPSRSR